MKNMDLFNFWMLITAMAYNWNKIIKYWLWFPPNGISILLPKGGHQPTLLPKGSHGLVHYERSVISSMMGPLAGVPGWGDWGPLAPQKWSQCPYRSPQWPRPSQCSWHSLLPQWAPWLLLSVRDPGVPHEPSLVMGPSASRLLLPGSLEVVSLAWQSLAPSLEMWVLTVLWTFNSSSALWHWAILSLELLLWGLCLEPQEMGGICPAAMTSLGGVTPFSTQGINLVIVPF